jgi:O-antigen/teichoic acid export membrane protein
MLLRHSGAYFLARGVPALVNFAALAVFTRLLSPTEYGHYALLIAVAGFLNGVLFQWVHLGLLRYLPAYPGDRQRFLATVAAGFALMMLFSGLLALLLWPLLSAQSLARWILPALALLWATAWFDTHQQLQTACLQPRLYGYLTLSKSLLSLSLGSLLGWLGYGAAGLAWGLFTGCVLSVLIFSQPHWRTPRPYRIDRALLQKLFTYGLPLTAGFALSITVASSDRLLLGWLRSADEAGLYAVGYDLPSYALGVIFSIVNLAAFPLAVTALEQQGEAAARQQLRKNFILLAALSIPAAVGIATLSPSIASVLFGEAFRAAAADIMPWIAIAAGFSALKSGYFDHAFTLGQRTAGMLRVLLLAAGANVLLNTVLIPSQGYRGAAYATLIAYGLGMLLSARDGRRIFRLPLPLRELSQIVLASLVMSAALQPLRHAQGVLMLGMAVALGMALYALCLLAMNSADSRTLLTTAISARWRAAK